MSEEITNIAVVDKPAEGFDSEGNPRFIRNNDGAVFIWSETLAAKAGFLECNGDGVPLSMGGGLTKDQIKENDDLIKAVQELTEIVESKDQKIAELEKAAASEDFAILSEEFKKVQAENASLKKAAKAKPTTTK